MNDIPEERKEDEQIDVKKSKSTPSSPLKNIDPLRISGVLKRNPQSNVPEIELNLAGSTSKSSHRATRSESPLKQ